MYWYRLVVLYFCIFSSFLFAAEGDEHTFELKWQEHGTGGSVPVQLDRQEPFEKEPDFGRRDILRGELSFGPPEHPEQMGFAWDKGDGKLYVDLNRDGDLTNDPNGMLETEDSCVGRNILEVRYEGGTRVARSWVPVRPVPSDESWFETAWNEYLKDEIVR